MKKKALTKRQILNELLIVEEKNAKYEASLQRVYRRGEKIDDKRRDLVGQLESICIKEQQKDGVRYPQVSIPEPILYKKHVFASIKTGCGGGTHFSIKPVKAIR